MTTYAPSRRRRSAAGFALITSVAAALAIAGCSAHRETSYSTGSSAVAPGRAPAGVQTGAGSAGGGTFNAAPDIAKAPAPGGTTVPVQPAVNQRSIIHTGQITVRVTDVTDAASQVTALATGAGGYLGGDNRQDDAGRSIATLTLRVPADRFDTVLAAIGKLGTEQNRTVSTQDVTSQVIDIAARLRTQQASVDRVRALLAQATTIAQIVSIESELTQREADLESLEAQQAQLGDLTTLSTITATLLGRQAAAGPTKPKQTGFLGGLSRGWHGFLASVAWLLTVIGAILPFVVGLGLVAWVVRLVARRWGRRTPAPAAPGVASPMPDAPTPPREET
jgi:Domain of unknown function (DUF4349)